MLYPEFEMVSFVEIQQGGRNWHHCAAIRIIIIIIGFQQSARAQGTRRR